MGGREGGAKVKTRPLEPALLRGALGEERSSTPSGTHPWLGVQWGGGRPWGRWWGGTEEWKGSVFPVHLGTREPVGLLGLILCPRSLPPAAQSPSPAPTSPARALPLHSETPFETPYNALGLNPTHTPSPRALPPNSGPPHSGGPPFHMLPLLFCTGPKQRPHPT